MPLFPELGPQYFSEFDREILSRMEAFYAESITINQSFWGEADTDTRFEAGDQTLWNDIYGNLPANRRRQFNFNRIRRNLQMISGYQRRNRKSIICVPVENADQKTADQFTKIFTWVNNQESVLETISESFYGSLTTGMNLLQVWVDYRNDPVNGNIRVDNCSYNSFLIDPFFRKADLSDCNSIWKRTFLTKRECISMLPQHAEVIIGLMGNANNRDGKFQFMPESYNYGMKNLLTYDEYYYRDYRTQKLLVDTQTGEAMEWASDDKDALRNFLSQYPQIIVQETEIPTVKLAIVVQGKVLYNGANPMGIDNYPFVPVFAYYNPQMPYFPWRIQGVVRGLRDAQYLYNRRKIIELDILESQINSGIKAKQNALLNPEDAITETGQGRLFIVKEGASMDDVQVIQPPQIPPSMIELSKILAQEIQEISGVNEELLGSATDDKPGILSMLRQGAGLTTLQSLFDNLDRAQKNLGKLFLKIIQANFTPGKVKRIIHDEPQPQFYNKAFGVYDVVVEDGLNTSTQRQMQFAQALHLRETGVQISDSDLLKMATIQDKTDLMESAAKREQQASEQAQKQAELQMAELKANIALAEARTVADKGLGIERLSRVEENKQLAVERASESEHNKAKMLLDVAKAIKELENIDIEQILKFVQMAKVLDERSAQNVAGAEAPAEVAAETQAAAQI